MEEKITALTQENSDLKKDMLENEENFQEQQETLQKQLDETNNELTRLKRMITSMVESLVGKHYSLEFQPKLIKQTWFFEISLLHFFLHRPS